MTTSVPAIEAKPQTLDELMLAMDVVDTLRHQDNLVERELDETRRDADLIERLRAIYKSQGIEVSDEVIRQGVTAIKEDRFAYTPPKPGLDRARQDRQGCWCCRLGAGTCDRRLVVWRGTAKAG
jgi:Family of unknown function (DUF6384)